MVSSTVLTLLIIPVVYFFYRSRQLKQMKKENV
jgi:Cu/Ag efflux pump CusA